MNVKHTAKLSNTELQMDDPTPLRVLTLPTATGSVSFSLHRNRISDFYRNESTIELLSSLSQSLKIICGSETAERFRTAQAKINVFLSKDKTVFVQRVEVNSQEEWLSLEEPAMLLSMMLKSCIF